MFSKWLLSCIICCFVDPMPSDDNNASGNRYRRDEEQRRNSQSSSDDEFGTLEDFLRSIRCSSLERKELEKGVTIAKSAPPNYGYDTSPKGKLFEKEAIYDKDQQIPTVTAKKLSIWSFLCPCFDYNDAVVVDAHRENQSKKAEILADLIGAAHNYDEGATF